MIYRLAVPGDALELKKLNDLFNGDNCNSLDRIATSLMRNPQEIVCVAEESGQLVGFCCGQIFKSMCYDTNYGEITELFVLEACRHQGVGQALLGFMESELKKMEIKGFQLFTGKENKAAQAVYLASGYEETPEIMFRKRNK